MKVFTISISWTWGSNHLLAIDIITANLHQQKQQKWAKNFLIPDQVFLQYNKTPQLWKQQQQKNSKNGPKFSRKTLTETAETDDDEVQSKNENRRNGEDRREIKERARGCASAHCDSACSEEHKEQKRAGLIKREA